MCVRLCVRVRGCVCVDAITLCPTRAVLYVAGDYLSIVSVEDDGPNEQFDLNFTFPFYDYPTSELFLSPNGYVQLSSVPQVGPRGGLSLASCSFPVWSCV